jgi:hypothetical protein
MRTRVISGLLWALGVALALALAGCSGGSGSTSTPTTTDGGGNSQQMQSLTTQETAQFGDGIITYANGSRGLIIDWHVVK